uniref:Histone deacetylase 14 n=1 Tax=Tanacetum cinerariifolium TaxID=118510 RepID=A0A6L2K7S5_TANCI|nr:hypothetical protein [Tanacetum cinerariifolium]
MPIPDALLTDEIKGASYYGEYKEHVAKYQNYLDAEHGKAEEGEATESPKATTVTKPKAAKATKPAGDPKPKPTPTQPSKAVPEKKKTERTHGPACLVVIREHDSGRIQPLPDVQGKGKEKVVDEKTAHDLLTIHTLKNKIPVDQFIFQRRTPIPNEASGLAESPSLDAELALTDNEIESNNARSNPGDAAESHPQSSHVVHAGPNLKHMDLEAIDASTHQNPKQMCEEFTTTAYPNVQENLKLPSEDQVILEEPASSTGTFSSLKNLEKELSFTDQFFVKKQQEEEPRKSNAEAEVQSMVLVFIHQDTSSVPLITTSVIDLTMSQSGSLLPTSIATTSAVTKTITIPPPPP